MYRFYTIHLSIVMRHCYLINKFKAWKISTFFKEDIKVGTYHITSTTGGFNSLVKVSNKFLAASCHKSRFWCLALNEINIRY